MPTLRPCGASNDNFPQRDLIRVVGGSVLAITSELPVVRSGKSQHVDHRGALQAPLGESSSYRLLYSISVIIDKLTRYMGLSLLGSSASEGRKPVDIEG